MGQLVKKYVFHTYVYLNSDVFEVLKDKNIVFGALIDNTEFLRDRVLFYLYCTNIIYFPQSFWC